MGEAVKTRIYRNLPPSFQPLVRLFRITTARGPLPLGARIRLLTSMHRLWMQTKDLRVPLPGGPVFLGAESFFVDAKTLSYVWREQAFAADCAGRLVLDLGGHKGYFGAWALQNGAAHVHSVEPESGNFARLEQARLLHSRAAHWTSDRVAVGERRGTVSLFVSAESWGHSIQEGMVDAVSTVEVQMVTLDDVLEQMKIQHPGLEIVLKVNVEGSVGSIILPAGVRSLRRVVEVHLDDEPGSPYDLTAVLEHLAAAGLDQVERIRDKIYRIRRAGSSGIA
jgi:FkbM family methyltransferase